MELKIPRECFKYGSGVEQVSNEGGDPYEIEGISTEGIIQLKIKGAMATWAVYVSQETLSKTNAIKSLFIENIKLLSRKQFILGTIFTLFNKKELERWVGSFNRQAFRVAVAGSEPYFLKEWHLTRVSQELMWCIFTFLHNLGISEEKADKFSEIFIHMIEYDNAYRFRFQDIMSSVSKKDFKTPRKAILRLIELIRDRDSNECGDKYIRIAKIMSYALLIPKVKRAFMVVIEGVTFENLQLTEADKYWLCTSNTYKAMGMTNEERKEYAKQKGWTYPSKLQ